MRRLAVAASLLLLAGCGGDDDPAQAYRDQARAICRDAEAAEQELVTKAGSLQAFGHGDVKIVRDEVARLRTLTPPAALRLDADQLVAQLAAGQGLDVNGNAVPPKRPRNPAAEQLDAQDQAKAFAAKLGLPACTK